MFVLCRNVCVCMGACVRARVVHLHTHTHTQSCYHRDKHGQKYFTYFSKRTSFYTTFNKVTVTRGHTGRL